eukprot:1178273-Rhodomonas_salina.1
MSGPNLAHRTALRTQCGTGLRGCYAGAMGCLILASACVMRCPVLAYACARQRAVMWPTRVLWDVRY